MSIFDARCKNWDKHVTKRKQQQENFKCLDDICFNRVILRGPNPRDIFTGASSVDKKLTRQKMFRFQRQHSSIKTRPPYKRAWIGRTRLQRTANVPKIARVVYPRQDSCSLALELTYLVNFCSGEATASHCSRSDVAMAWSQAHTPSTYKNNSRSISLSLPFTVGLQSADFL